MVDGGGELTPIHWKILSSALQSGHNGEGFSWSHPDIERNNGEVFTLPHQFLVESSGFLRIPRNPRNEPGMNQNLNQNLNQNFH
jgi:hypothetical protein